MFKDLIIKLLPNSVIKKIIADDQLARMGSFIDLKNNSKAFLMLPENQISLSDIDKLVKNYVSDFARVPNAIFMTRAQEECLALTLLPMTRFTNGNNDTHSGNFLPHSIDQIHGKGYTLKVIVVRASPLGGPFVNFIEDLG